ncbi:hypothetical protein AAZV13_02G008950 [Glycine max]
MSVYIFVLQLPTIFNEFTYAHDHSKGCCHASKVELLPFFNQLLSHSCHCCSALLLSISLADLKFGDREVTLTKSWYCFFKRGGKMCVKYMLKELGKCECY